MSDMPKYFLVSHKDCPKDIREKFGSTYIGVYLKREIDEYMNQLEAKNKRLVELVKLIDIEEGIDCLTTHAPDRAEELRRGLREFLASMEKDDE